MNSRRKGCAGERELAAAIHHELGVRLLRRLDQPRASGHDLDLHPDEAGPVAAQIARYAIECKRGATASPATVAGWWRQAVAQAARCGRIPLLCYRADRQDWVCVLPLQALHPDLPDWTETMDYTASLSLPGWAAVMRETLPQPTRAVR